LLAVVQVALLLVQVITALVVVQVELSIHHLYRFQKEAQLL
jgi:hypothetical protein